MLEVKKPEKVDFHVRYDPASFGPVKSQSDLIDVYLQTDFGIVHFRASKEITDEQKQELFDKLNKQLGEASKYLNHIRN